MNTITVSATKNVMDDSHRTFEERALELEKMQQLEDEQRKRERKSIYQDFAQLNRKNIIHLIKASQVNPKALGVLLFFIEHCNKMNAIVCSYQVLQEQLGLSKPTVTRSIKYLKENGFIHVYKSGTSNVYVINDNLIWTNSGDKAKYCKFPAEVILSASEQDEIAQDRALKFDCEKVILMNDEDEEA